MYKTIRYGLVLLGLWFPLMAQAVCDFTFSATPTFATVCAGSFGSGIYTITNNTPATVAINYIRIVSNDALPVASSSIVAAPTNNCGSSLASGASCNIQLNLQPLALGAFNRTLQVGIDTRQVQIAGPAITSTAGCGGAIGGGVAAPTISGFPFGAGSPTILAYSTVTNTGPTIINGDVHVSPGSAITGFPPGTVINGTFHSADATAATSQANATTFYNSLVALPCGTNLTGQDLGGRTLAPGVYCFDTSAQLTGTLILSGGGLYTFQIGSTLTTASNSNIVLAGGATSDDVRFAVGSSATLGTNSAFTGTIVAVASITIQTGATLAGRAWARGGAVTLDTNVVNPG